MYEYNGLHVLCDWLSFTIKKKTVFEFLDMFGLSATSFRIAPHGAQGYKHMIRHKEYHITILYDGNENMGVHCDIKGSAVAYFLECFKESYLVDTPWGTMAYEVQEFDELEDIIPVLFKRIIENGWFTRLDIAIDDYGCNFFSCKDVEKILDARLYVARFRKWESIKQKDSNGIITGHTIYCGSQRSSGIFLRIYDKQLEQAQKIEGANNPAWVRWEMVLSDEHADGFANHIIDKVGFAPASTALLNGFVRFVRRDDSNTSRCSTLPKWKKFVNTAEKLRICAPKKEKTVLRSFAWFESQCAPTIAGLIVANGGSCDFIMDDIVKQYSRLSQRDREMFEGYCMDVEKQMIEDGLKEMEGSV